MSSFTQKLEAKFRKKANEKKHIKILKLQIPQQSHMHEDDITPLKSSFSAFQNLLQKSKGPEKLTVEKY